MTPKLVIFTDVGDTIIDEGTEIREVEEGVVLRAECIPGAKEAMLELYKKGYIIAMVADGLVESFHNTMTQNGLDHIFAVKVISEALGTHKPDAKMFETAMNLLGLTDADKSRVIMVGNNLKRDICGANRFGITSVHLAWTERYPKIPACPEEQPDYTILTPDELPALVERLNAQLAEEETK